MKKLQFLSRNLAFNIIGGIILLLAVFGLIISAIGYMSFTSTFRKEYAESTYHIADTATALVNGDHLSAYLDGEETEEYEETRDNLDTYCKKMSISLVYVIMVDRSDYGRFVSVFNSVNNEVDNSEYTAWELGHKRDTTNDEYRQKYRAVYDQESAYETVYRLKTTDGQHPHITTMVPVLDSAGETAAILCVQRPAREVREARRPYVISIVVWTVLFALIASLFATFFIRKQFVNPIKKVSREASRFASENTKGVTLSGISRYEELAELARSIDTMETDMVNHIENLTAATAQQERISTELTLATRIQAAMLPHDFPPYPDRTEFDLYASMDPAREVGGDFYDFFLVDEDHLCILIADVSGKGIPAALFMMVSKIILQSCAMLGVSASGILTKTNEAICSSNPENMFVTVWLGMLEISTGKLTCANAGHEYPIVKHPDGTYELFKDRHGLVIGAMDGIKYKDYELTLEPGSKIFVYTDGLPEATDAEGKMFGLERVVDTLNQDPEADPRTVLRDMRRAVDGFVQDAEQFDDLTMLCMTYKGKEGGRG